MRDFDVIRNDGARDIKDKNGKLRLAVEPLIPRPYSNLSPFYKFPHIFVEWTVTQINEEFPSVKKVMKMRGHISLRRLFVGKLNYL